MVVIIGLNPIDGKMIMVFDSLHQCLSTSTFLLSFALSFKLKAFGVQSIDCVRNKLFAKIYNNIFHSIGNVISHLLSSLLALTIFVDVSANQLISNIFHKEFDIIYPK